MDLPRLLFSTSAYETLGNDLAARGTMDRGSVTRRLFPDGERYFCIDTNVAGRDVVLLGGTISEADTLEVYDLASAIVKYGARSLAIVVPYFGYATMERAIRPGEVVTAKTRARLLSSIPVATTPNRVLLVDVHTEGLPYYFEGSVVVTHVYAKPLVARLVRELGGTDLVVACTDAGRAKWVESLANDMGVSASFVFKKRMDGERTHVTAVSAHVEGKTVVIYDDLIRTGSSLVGAARAYLDAGAARVVAVATHGLFPGDALARIRASGVVEKVACTDSHPRARTLEDDYLRVESIAALLAAAL